MGKAEYNKVVKELEAIGIAAHVTVIYGVKTDLSHFVDEVVDTKTATCHPDRIRGGDKFCPECGSPAVVKEEGRQVKKEYQFLLPPNVGVGMGLEYWLHHQASYGSPFVRSSSPIRCGDILPGKKLRRDYTIKQ